MSSNKSGSLSTSVGERMSSFFRRLVMSHKVVNVHSCIPDNQANMMIDLFRQKNEEDEMSDTKHSPIRSKKSGTKYQSTGRAVKVSSADPKSDRATGNEKPVETRNAVRTPGSVKDAIVCDNNASKSKLCARRDKGNLEKGAVPKSVEVSEARMKGKRLRNIKSESQGCRSIISCQGVERTEMDGKNDVSTSRREAGADVICMKEEEQATSAPRRRIRPKTCTVRDPMFVWPKSENGIETQPVGMVIDKGKRGPAYKAKVYKNFRPDTPCPPPVWSSDSDPLDGLDELLDDVIKMEDRYLQRRLKAACKSRAKPQFDPETYLTRTEKSAGIREISGNTNKNQSQATASTAQDVHPGNESMRNEGKSKQNSIPEVVSTGSCKRGDTCTLSPSLP